MKELSLHILDIAQNSVSAHATQIDITVEENTQDNLFRITIADNGKGMSEDFLKNVMDPFTTTRTTRKVGMGISLLKLAANQAGGDLTISSQLGVGTVVTATFQHNSIDRPPLGDIAQTMSVLISCNLSIDFTYLHSYNGVEFLLNTKQIKELLGGVPLNEPEVILWMQDYLNEGISNLSGGVVE